MAGTALPADGGLSDVMNLLTLVKSPGDSTSTTKNTVDATGQKALLDSILTGNTSLPGLASVAQGQKSAGLYNSSVNTQLTNDLLTRATAEIAAKNSTQSTTQHKAPMFNGKQLLTMFAASAAKKALGPTFKGLADKTGLSDIGDKLANSLGLGPGGAAGGSTAVAPISETLSPAALDASSAVADTVGTNLLDGIGIATGESAVGTGTDVAGLEALDSAAASEGTGALAGIGTAGAAESGADVAGLTALDSAAAAEGGSAVAGEGGSALLGEAGSVAPWAALAVYGGLDVAHDIKQGDSDVLWADALGGLGTGDIVDALKQGGGVDNIIANSAGPAAPLVQNIEDTAGKAWVICTQLNSVGLLDDELYQASAERVSYLSQEVLAGYHYWAIPVTKKLRAGSPILTKLFSYLAKSRCEYLLGKPRVWGWLSVILGEPICAAIGSYALKRNKNIPDWKELYAR
jgi:hypothetical protein